MERERARTYSDGSRRQSSISASFFLKLFVASFVQVIRAVGSREPPPKFVLACLVQVLSRRTDSRRIHSSTAAEQAGIAAFLSAATRSSDLSATILSRQAQKYMLC
jgi:hypothetical protein